MAFSKLQTAGEIALLTTLANFGMMPSAATAQIMDKQLADSDDMSAVQYLNDLKECVVGSQNEPLPMPFLEGALIVAEIIGWEAETCVVETTVFLAEEPETKSIMSYCEHTAATIALMTDDIAYEQARTGNYSFSTDNERDMALSMAMESECALNFEWFEELTGETL